MCFGKTSARERSLHDSFTALDAFVICVLERRELAVAAGVRSGGGCEEVGAGALRDDDDRVPLGLDDALQMRQRSLMCVLLLEF